MNTISAVSTALPDRFGKYSVLRHLASGGMADLFLARATGIVGFEKIVVIKRIREDLVGDNEITELFLHEARLAATLEHPHIAQVYDVGIVNDSYFFAMEYVHGLDLRKIMRTAIAKRRTVPLADAIQIGIGVCAALHYAHEKRNARGKSLGIIHRDVSPSNVLVSYDGAVKVCDFGVAKATSRTHQTAHGVLKGKISYMSPEQARCLPIDRRSDIFSIAIVLYELTTLTKLFRGASDLEVMKRLTEGNIPPPSTLRADYPRELERILLKALSAEPDHRYATAQQMQLDLEAFARDQRLALSSVNLERLMVELFDDHIDAWQEAQRDGKDLAEHLLDRPVSSPSSTPTPDRAGSDDHSLDLEVSESRPRGGPRPSASRWLFGAAALALLAMGLFVNGGRDPEAEVTALVQAEAEKLATALDAEARALHMRADGIATMPMLRAAIGTDAGTLKDMAASELVLAPGKNEVLELFQLGVDGKSESLLRLPAGAPRQQPLPGRDTRVELRQGRIVITASAVVSPLYRARAAGGSIVITNELDLTGLKRRLAPHVVQAGLRGLGGTVRILDGNAAADAPMVTALVPPGGELSLPELSIDVIPRSASAQWPSLARYGCWLLAAVFLAVMLRQQRRRRR